MQSQLEAIAWVSEHLSIVGMGTLLLFSTWQIKRRSKKTKTAQKALKKAIDTQSNEPLTMHPEFNPKLCVGCGTCTRACPEGEVIQLVHHRPVLVAPTKCVGHGECERVCPNGAITLVFGTKTRGMDIPRITSNFETNVPGLYVAGELGGMGLIRNAIKQGNLSAIHALKNLSSGQADTDLLIIGAGPAGISASLTAISLKKRYRCIEQNSFGGTVYNFPRQKIVMTHPAQLPGIGAMKFKGNRCSKEELLEYWSEIRMKTGLKIEENTRFETLTKNENIFQVKTNKGIITAKKVILGLGVRGSPRKLGLPNEDLPKVTYNLIDPEQYQNTDIAVVGGGNAAVEAAQYLAKAAYQNRVILLVRGAAFDRCNEANQKEIEALVQAGRVKILFNSSVKEIQKDNLSIEEKGKPPYKVQNDFLFVFAGAESPHKFLMSLGIQIDKKFGESLKKAA